MYSFTNMKNGDFDIPMNIYCTLNSIILADIAKGAFRENSGKRRIPIRENERKFGRRRVLAMEEWLKGVGPMQPR